MIFNKTYWVNVSKNIVYLLLSLIGIYLAFKLSVFYMPFLVAFIISILLEPIIKSIMRKTNLSRRTSSIIIFVVASFCILGILVWGIYTIVLESSTLLESLNSYIEKTYVLYEKTIEWIRLKELTLPKETIEIVDSSAKDILKQIIEWSREKLTSIVNAVTYMPVLLTQLIVSIVALYFICVDKIYIIDQVEHHMPKPWTKKIQLHFREITKILGGYLKAELTLILVSFVILLIGLYSMKILGINVEYPLLMASIVAFVDALPILGSGIVMIPWAIISAINGEFVFGISIIVLLITMSIIRQILEPKLISQNIGIHPIFTLIAMYTGFKLIGIIGMLIGPVILIILKSIFANLITEGVFKSLFGRK